MIKMEEGILVHPFRLRFGKLDHHTGASAGTVAQEEMPTVLLYEAAIYAVAALTALSGVVVMVRMYETHPPASRAVTV